MGSASREALAAAREILSAQSRSITLATADDLFQAARVIGDSKQLRGILSDPSTDGNAKSTLVQRLFGSLSPVALAALTDASSRRWSRPSQFVAGIEELGIRAAAIAAGPDSDLETQLFAFSTAIESSPDLELALRSKLGAPSSKLELVERLLNRASAPTRAVVRQLVMQPRGRSMRVALRAAGVVVADQNGQIVANVTAASALDSAQIDRLRAGLARRYGTRLSINQIVDPSVIGGLRVTVGDDVIDGSVSTRLAELRQRLAG